ncbi:MAG TPA: serine--tRNA ligase, partial [Thermoplasmata archaeon]|nr:serine--tRNA ligase [Thermoplasmata archaeon]
MLDPKRLRSETARVREAISFKKTKADLDGYLERDERRRELLVRVEGLKHRRNEASEEIGRLKRRGEDVSARVAVMKEVGDEVKSLDEKIAGIESELHEILAWVPNVPHESVPM